MTIFIPDFAPDRSAYALDAARSILNALPVTDRWGPFPSLTEVSDALPSQVKGAISVRTNAGSWATFLGTAAKLYKLDVSASPYGFTDYTRLAGGDYGVPTTDRWSFAPVGGRLLAANLTDDVQYLDVDSGSNFAALPGSPPKAKFVWTCSEFVMLGHLANEPNFLQWSAYGDSEAWTRGLGGAWKQELPDGGEVMGGFGNERGSIIFQRSKIRAAVFTADASAFDIVIVNEARGAIAPYCIVAIGPGEYFYLSDDGFYVFAGGQDIPIGNERVDRWFLGADSEDLTSEVDRENLSAVRAFLDPFRKVVIVQYPKVDGSFGLLGCAYRLTGQDGKPGRWFLLDFSVEEIVALATAGITIDGLANLYASIDAIDQPFDSRLFSGGKPTIGAITTDHKLAFFTGNNLAATLTMPKMQLTPGYRSLLQEVSVVGDLDPTDITIDVAVTDKRGDTSVFSSSYSAETDGTGIFKTLDDGRFHQTRFNIPAATDWNSIAGIDENESVWKQTGRA
jgi:hypothetical protein